MAVLVIPTRSDLDNYKFTIDLEGLTYGFEFHYNGRMQKWVFDLTQEDGTPILQSTPVYVNQLPLQRFQTELKPPGEILFLDTSGANLDPTEDDLGTRVLMMYIESVEGT